MLKIGVLGVGQAGGNITEKAYEKKFITGAINFQKDLDTLIKVKNKYPIPKGFGAGKDRLKAINSAQENYDGMIKFVKDTFVNIDILFIAFSMGGGTGSGIAPILIDCLLDEVDYPIGAIAVLPDKKEDATAQGNTAKALQELTNIDGIASVFIIDNEQARSNLPDFDRQKLYDYTNSYIMTNLERVIELTQKSSTISNFDPEDLLNLLSTNGYAMISTANLTESYDNGNYLYTKDSIAEDIKYSWENTIYPPMEYGAIQKAGVIAEIKAGITDRLDTDTIFKDTGLPITLFQGIYPDINNVITTILTGMDYPLRRFEDIDNILDANKDLIQRKMQRKGYQSKVDWLDQPATGRRQKKTASTDIMSKFEKYKR